MSTSESLARACAAPASTARGRATRERIVAAASQLIHAHGVERTTLEAVRAVTGVSKSQLYHYFTDKADLVRAVVARQAATVLQAQQPELDAIDSFAALDRWCDKVLLLQRGGGGLGCPLGTLVAEIADDEPGRRALSAAFGAWQDRLRRGLQAMQEIGEIRPSADVDVLAWALLTATQGGLLLAQATGSARPLHIALDTAVAQVRAAGAAA